MLSSFVLSSASFQRFVRSFPSYLYLCTFSQCLLLIHVLLCRSSLFFLCSYKHSYPCSCPCSVLLFFFSFTFNRSHNVLDNFVFPCSSKSSFEQHLCVSFCIQQEWSYGYKQWSSQSKLTYVLVLVCHNCRISSPQYNKQLSFSFTTCI